MEIKFHGATKEVGRSCIELQHDDRRFLLDAGIKICEEGSLYPETFDVENMDAVFISHAHLDHTGALPLFQHQGLRCPIYAKAITKAITKYLLKDSLHIELLSKQDVAYSEDNIYNALSFFQNVNYNKSYKSHDMRFKFLDAGHIPGSASILLGFGKKNLLYTGDINTSETNLLKGADTNYNTKIDVMICEATYGDRNHPDRNAEEKDFFSNINQTLDKGGSVLIPSFGVGRAQEILLMLNEKKFDAPVYLDGMAKKITSRFIGDMVKDPERLRQAFRKAKLVHGFRERKEIVKEQGIFVTTSGMMDGGPAIDYLKHIWFEKNNSILMTGYQAEGTNGRMLLEDGHVVLDGQRFNVKCNVKKYDFSAHSDLKGLQQLIKKVGPEILFLNHGDAPSIDNLARWAAKQNIEVHAPEFGEEFEVEL